MKSAIVIAVVTSLLIWADPSPASAQEPLTLGQSLTIALEQNPDLRSAGKSRHQARYNVISARANAFPSLSFVGSFQRNWELPEFVFSPPPGFPGANGEIRVRTGVENTVLGGLVLEQPLYTGGALSAGIGIASDGFRMSEYSYDAVEQHTIETVYTAFFGVLLAESLIEVAETAVENAEENLRQVRSRYDEGAASRFELLRAEVQLATIQPNLTEARHRHAASIENLTDLLGMDKHSEIIVTGSFDQRDRTLLGSDVDELIEQAYRYRPEFRMQQMHREINRKHVRIARSEFLPRLVFASSVQWQALRDDLDLQLNDFTRFSNSELRLQIPLFNGFGSRARYQEAQAEFEKSRIQEEYLRNRIATEIRHKYNLLVEAHEILGTQQKVVEQAREGLQLANLLYEEGAATLLEVIDAQLAVTRASTSYFQAVYNYNTVSIQLERAIGILRADSI